jgi:hypothetical protein
VLRLQRASSHDSESDAESPLERQALISPSDTDISELLRLFELLDQWDRRSSG